METLKINLERENYDNIATNNVNSYFENLLNKNTNSIEKVKNSRRNNTNPKKRPNCWYDRELRSFKNKKRMILKNLLTQP